LLAFCVFAPAFSFLKSGGAGAAGWRCSFEDWLARVAADTSKDRNGQRAEALGSSLPPALLAL